MTNDSSTKSKQEKKTKKHLTDEMIGGITRILDGWTGKLTWELFVKKIEPKYGLYSRQALERHSRIKSSFANRKADLRLNIQPKYSQLSILEAKLAEQNERLRAENIRLERENDSLLEQFVRWQYNASVRGVSESQLNMALPAIDREVTDAKLRRASSRKIK